MALDLIKAPLFKALLAVLSVALMLCIVAPSGAMAAASWGFNGTMKAENVSLFLSRAFTDDEHADWVYPTQPLMDRGLFLVSWYSSRASVQPARLGAINIVNGDTPSFDMVLIQDSTVARSSPERPVVAYGYTGSYDWDLSGPLPALDTGNVLMGGGVDSVNGLSSTVVDSFFALNGNNLLMALDGGAFHSLPMAMAGAIATLDTTATFYYDGTYGNSSILIFGGQNATHILDTMYRPHYATATATTPDSWVIVPPTGGQAPGARTDLAGASFSGKWYVFGGRDTTGVFGDTWVYDFATSTWSNLTDFGFVTFADASSEAATSNDGKSLPLTPPARYGHSMGHITGANSLGALTDYILLVGGTNGATYFDDIWLLDPISGYWEQITPPAGKASYTPRAYAGLFPSNNVSTAWIFGGHNNATGYNNNTLADLFIIDFTVPSPPGPAFKSLPNNIIAGVAGGILLVLIITVVVLKVTDRNNN